MTEEDESRPAESGGFRVNFVLIAAIHLLVLGVILLLAIFPFRKKDQELVWMNPGSFGSGNSQTDSNAGNAHSNDASHEEENSLPSPEPTVTPEPTALSTPPPATTEPTVEMPSSTPTPKPSTLLTPKPAVTASPPNLATPKPTPSAAPKPAQSPKPSPSPKPSRSPKPTPKPTAKSTPKPSAKPSPKPSAEQSSSPKPKPSASPAHQSPATPRKEEDKLAKNQGTSSSTAHKPDNKEGANKGSKPDSGNGSNSSGSGSASGNGDADLGQYAEIIKNRFDGAWNQPHGQIPTGSALIVTVRLKIEADGTVTEFSIVEGSGNSVVDETVKEAGNKIKRLPPPPGGTGFSPMIRFELRND
jgi:TonB family protein